MKTKTLKMIIVDDERIILESLETLIDWKEIGIEVVGTADSGATALDLAFKLGPDIILSDISMPSFTGLEMLETLRKKQIKVEIVFISAYSKFEYAKEAIKLGAYDYVLKPIKEDQLVETVSRCANKIREAAMNSSISEIKEVPEISNEDIRKEQAPTSMRLVNLAVDYIHENYDKDISLSQVAGNLYISPPYLSKIFSTQMHETFTRYLLSYRIKIAKELLRDTHLKVYEVAERVGYSDIVHFSKLFKQTTGQTPKQYRNRTGVGHQAE